MKDRKEGIIVDDLIQSGYIGICLNNGWVKAKKYKPHIFYKLINKFKHKYYHRDHSYRISLLNTIAWWLPTKKLRKKFRRKFLI